MAVVRYDPYTDKFIYEKQTKVHVEPIIATTSTGERWVSVKCELTDECIDRIAEVVVQKLREEQEE